MCQLTMVKVRHQCGHVVDSYGYILQCPASLANIPPSPCASPLTNWSFGLRIVRNPCVDCLAKGSWRQTAQGGWERVTRRKLACFWE
ncbi:hypothetical protein I7I53_12260 [Histoplasma capsulatum var. duboisii H88]|uniref:Uncharacterized protein n=1 Tax=Ajellomyces capsulatus (strain H88) TaxID=544711 RepID=A0A8A1LZG9_AJEC8|nr:hypothetical protein I7I53_12260 [Histoplasma capsulatum var. duboisii H88]